MSHKDASLPKKQRAESLLRERNFPEARRLLEEIVGSDRTDVDAWMYLSMIYAQTGPVGEFEKCCRQAVSANPHVPNAHFNLGVALSMQGKVSDAIQSYRQAVKLKPDHILALFNLGHTLQRVFQLDEALSCYSRVLGIKPTPIDHVPPNLNATVYHYMANVLKAQGKMKEAIVHYRRALDLNPNLTGAHSDMLLALNYDSPDAKSVFEEHVNWGRHHGYAGAHVFQHRHSREPDRPLRIGYVSPDFYKHAVTFFFEPLLAHHDRSRIVPVCYSLTQKSDNVTARLRSLSAQWRDVFAMNDEQVAGQIFADGIDILVDLAGHMGENRLAVFSRKPAPIQVSWLGYPNTTGLTAIDYRLTDIWADPPGLTDRFYTERLFRLPRGFLCYRPSESAPAIGPRPSLATGAITFGSFNNLSKVTPGTIALWSSILRDVPRSRLILKNASFTDIPTREPYYQEFEKHGIGRDRLDFRGMHRELTDHQSVYNAIDIGLDPFPYNGATTTCEALWMGVPVITLTGKMHAGRVGVSILTQMEMTDLIASDPDDYVRIAVELANNPTRLSELRSSLRQRMAASPLCDARSFALAVEDAYRTMWRQWCAT
ncbi:MAG TPA: tetratricopeptide repeat protein [Acidobacteriota bacterium]|nr:tetratricopeptide repeat protein [Acidobacteriota bacterium]